MSVAEKVTFGEAIRQGFVWLLERHPEVFVIGQGLWSPWYVGNTMTDLDKQFGIERVIDSPVSELATTGAAIGASLCGYRPVVVHPRMDFMLMATDPIVNQAAKWCHMLGGQSSPAVTIRGIVNRGGEQGAQHSQALHSMFAHIPGLRVVMPSTVQDARDLLIASVLDDSPVLYIDDRWSASREGELPPVEPLKLSEQGPVVRRSGADATLVGAGFSAQQCEEAAERLAARGVDCEVIDLRVLNPLDAAALVESVAKTGRLCVVDGGWRTCGLGGELIARVAEASDPGVWRARPRRLTLPDAPAPTSAPLEAAYYTEVDQIVAETEALMKEARA